MKDNFFFFEKLTLAGLARLAADLLARLDNIGALNNFAEHDVLAIEPGSLDGRLSIIVTLKNVSNAMKDRQKTTNTNGEKETKRKEKKKQMQTNTRKQEKIEKEKEKERKENLR